MIEIKRECFICKGNPDHFIPFSRYMRMEGGIRYRGLYLCENHKDYYKNKILIYTPGCVIAESMSINTFVPKERLLSKKEKEALDLLKKAGILEEVKRETAQIRISGTIDTDSPTLYTRDRVINSNSMQVEVVKKEQRIKVNQEGTIQKTGG